jgi:4-hydroxybenzoate polyprenyltransferase
MARGSLGALLGLGRLHIVSIGAVGTLTFGWLLTGRYPWLLAALSGLDWFLVNLLNRVVDLPEDTANRIAGTDLAQRHRRAILGAGFTLLIASLLLGHVLAPSVTALRMGFHLLGLGYNWPLLPGRRRIKQLYFWKNAASATGFVLTVFAYPLAAAGCWPFAQPTAAMPPGISPATVALAVAFFAPFELSYEVIYDLRDVAGDRAAGLRTFPVVHGTRGAMRIVIGLLLGSLAPLGVGYALGLVPWRLAIMGAAPLIQLGATELRLRRGIDARFCIGLTWLGVALLITYHLWFLGHLPGSEIPS